MRTVMGDEVTHMLQCLQSDSSEQTEELFKSVYQELSKIARQLKRHERANHTLCTSALVHEAYLHLSSQQQSQWKNRSHFYAIASMTMRRVLINYARDRVAAKRGGHEFPESLDENSGLPQSIDYEELLTVNQLMEELEQIDSHAVRVIECRYFTGLTIEETAEALQMSASTVKRKWQFAKAWLARKMQNQDAI